MQSVPPAQLKEWFRTAVESAPADATPLVLDVRESWEFQTASVKPDGFELMHMPMRSVPARYAELDRNRPLACLCHHGARSAQVVHFLMNQGFSNVVNIHGGINAWSHEFDSNVPLY